MKWFLNIEKFIQIYYHRCQADVLGIGVSYKKLPLRFRKAGRVWCGGARETRKPRVTIE